MNSTIQENKILKKPHPKAKSAPSKLKRVLILLLVSALLAGLGTGVFFFLRPSAIPREGIFKNGVSSFSSLLKKIAPGEQNPVFNFQGTFIGEKGAIVMINDEMAAAEAEINGVRILETKGKTIHVEYHGKQYTLTVGESLDPATTRRSN